MATNTCRASYAIETWNGLITMSDFTSGRVVCCLEEAMQLKNNGRFVDSNSKLYSLQQGARSHVSRLKFSSP